MHDIVTINLDNEMDLILAHRRSMKMAELCGLPSSAQTRFATAVSEVARCSIARGKDSVLTIGINVLRPTHKEVQAVLQDSVDLKKTSPEAYAYASRISGHIGYELSGKGSVTSLACLIAAPGLITETKIKGFRDYFRHELPLSPYDEIRKKNLELVSLTEKLGESENRYRQLTDTLPVLICIADERNRVLLTNTWLRDYLGGSPEAMDRASLSEHVHPEDLEALLRGWENAKKGDAGYSGQARIRSGGAFAWHLVSIVANRHDEGARNWLVCMVDIEAQKVVEATLQDNSELREAQRQLEDANTQLSFKNQELEQFAFVASHDLQEPLRKIMFMISRASGLMDDAQRKALYLDKISHAADRMSKLITDVLDYSRADNLSRDFGPVDLNDALAQASQDLSFAISDTHASIHSVALPHVRGSEAQLRQLFYNIVGNSLKFNAGTPDVHIAYSLTDCDGVGNFPEARGKFHVISIRDNGIGMDPAYSGRVFDMFQRLHHREDFAGNGIGLALCRRIMVNHGGAIDFDSKKGEGTTFRLYFPAA